MLRWAGLAKRKVAVPSEVAGEDEVLDAGSADGELPLEKRLATLIAEGCADEYMNDPHAKHASENAHVDDDLSETLSDTFGFESEPLVACAEASSSSMAERPCQHRKSVWTTYPSPSCAKLVPREERLCMMPECEQCQNRLCGPRSRSLNMKVCVFCPLGRSFR